MINKLKSYLQTKEGQKVTLEYIHKINYDAYKGFLKVSKLIDKYKDYDDFLNTFLKWETKFEERYMKKHHASTNSTLFNCFYEFVKKYGYLKGNLDNEDFLEELVEWQGYTFKLYVGQGSFFKIEKDNKIIFQSI